MRAQEHPDERSRLAALRAYGVLDTPPEKDFDDIAALASQICETPIAVVNLIDEGRQWFKAEVGLGVRETPLDSSICAHAILQKGILEVPDTLLDRRFQDNPLVTGEPHLRFYAGALLENEEGLPLGTLCVLDYEPRQLSEVQRQTLRVLAAQVMAQLELRRKVKELERRQRENELERATQRTLFAESPAFIAVLSGPDLTFEYVNEAYYQLVGHREIVGKPLLTALPEIEGQGYVEHLRSVMESGVPYTTPERAVLLQPVSGGPLLERFVALSYQPFRDVDGTVTGVYAHGFDVTEQVLAKRALAAERQQFRILLDEVPAHVVTLRGPRLQYEFANRAFMRFVGRDDFIGLGAEEAWPVPPEHLALLRHILATGEAFEGREALVVSPPKPDEPPSEGYFDFMFQPLHEADGTVSGVFVHSLDVTEKVMARRELAASEERYRTLFETATLGIVYQDAEARIIAANPAAQRILGLTLDQMQGRSSMDPRWRAVRPDGSDYPGEEHPVPTALRTGRIERAPMGVFHPAEEAYRWLDVTAVPQFREGESRPHLVYALFEDITDRRRAEEALREEQSRLSQALSLGRVLAYEWHPATDLCIRSENAREILGLPEAARGTGSEFLQLVHPEDRERFIETAQNPHRGGYRLEYRLLLPDGTTLWVEDTASPEFDDSGNLVRMRGLMADITERRLTVEDLERRVEDRTSALVVKNQELEGFTYSVSHDMRAPLRAMVAYSRIVLEEEGPKLSPEGRQHLERLSGAALKMAQLVDDLLQYARLGVRELRRELVDLGDLVRAAVADAEREHPESGVRVEVEPDLIADCDPRLIGMALHNLVDNACKYRREGTPVVVRFGVEERDGGRVYTLRDNGIGFDMAYVDKLFRPFERLHREEYAGTGIGLANVRRAIERHGGRVWAEGRLGEGAAFSFTLP